MDSILSKRQKKLVAKARGNGFLTRMDFIQVYSSPLAMKGAIERLCLLEIIKPDVSGTRFNYCDKNDKQTVLMLQDEKRIY
jgi:hypothetical protein